MATTSHIKKARKMRRIRHRIFIAILILLPIMIGLFILRMILNNNAAPPLDSTAPVSVTNAVTPDETISSEPLSELPAIEELDLADNDNSDDTVSSDTVTAEDKFSPVTMLFTGDVLLSNYVLSNYDASGIDGVVSPVLLDEMRSADITVINNEFPFSTRGTPSPDKQFTFRVNPEYVAALTDMGVDIAGLANNHVLDYGPDALFDTFDTLDSAGIDYMGSGANLERASALITKEAGGRTFGFLAASRVIPFTSWDAVNSSPGVFTTYDSTRLVAAIKDASKSCDYLTVFVHWGIEREAMPENYQTVLAQEYIDAGANLVIGSHPHVLQGMSFYKEKPIIYSLGNYIFNREIARTAAFKVTLDEELTPVYEIIPASANSAYTSACDGEKRLEILQYIESISDGISILKDGELLPAE
ncbi:MAG: CapA family protein [bacterium]|nr:CapA family protein [bacterium]